MITATALLTFAIFAIVVIAVAVGLNWLISTAPFMDGGLKAILGWLIWAIAGIVLLVHPLSLSGVNI